MWERTGTCTVTNGSPTITGSGTAWAANVRAGWGFQGPDGRVYEVLAVVSDTEITLARNYAGSTLAGQQYDLFPTQGEIRDLAAQAAALVAAVGAMVNGAGAGKFSAGSAAAPGVSAATDLDTGIAWLAANVLGISTGGVERMRVTATGVGINESAPLSRLHIGGGGELITMERAADNQPYLQIGSPAGTTALSLKNIGGLTSELLLDGGLAVVRTNSADRLRIENGGFVGLGNLGAADATVLLDVADTSAAVMRVASDGTQAVITERASAAAANPAQLQLRRSRGTVASPAAVQQGDEIGDISFFGYDGAGIQRAARIQAYVDNTPGAGDMPGRLTFSTTPDGTGTPFERMRITSNGAVGINTTSPVTELHVRGAGEVIRTEGTAERGSGNVFNTFHDPTGRKGYVGYGSTVDDDLYINNEMNAALRLCTNGAERMRINSTGNVGIGTTTPAYKLQVSGAAAVSRLGGAVEAPTGGYNANTTAILAPGGGTSGSGAALSVIGNNAATAAVYLGDTDDADIAGLVLDNADDSLTLRNSATGRIVINSAGHTIIDVQSAVPALSENGTLALQRLTNSTLRIHMRGGDGVLRTLDLTGFA